MCILVNWCVDLASPELAAVKAEVDDDALTKAMESVKSTVRLSGRHLVDSKKVQENKAEQLEKAAGSE
jgi:transcriptional regulator NrdR family protein